MPISLRIVDGNGSEAAGASDTGGAFAIRAQALVSGYGHVVVDWPDKPTGQAQQTCWVSEGPDCDLGTIRIGAGNLGVSGTAMSSGRELLRGAQVTAEWVGTRPASWLQGVRRFRQPNRIQGSCQVNEDGTYELLLASPGRYLVRGQWREKTTHRLVYVETGEHREDFALVDGAQLEVQFTDESTLDVSSVFAMPVGDPLTLLGEAPADPRLELSKLSESRYRIRGLLPGCYSLGMQLNGGRIWWVESQLQVPLQGISLQKAGPDIGQIQVTNATLSLACDARTGRRAADDASRERSARPTIRASLEPLV